MRAGINIRFVLEISHLFVEIKNRVFVVGVINKDSKQFDSKQFDSNSLIAGDLQP